MIRGQVIGEVWATRKSEKLDGRRLVLIGVEDADRVMVAIDTLDARMEWLDQVCGWYAK